MDCAAEQALIERIVLGDEAALGQLYEQLWPRAFGIALRVLRDSGEAEDVLQDTFIEIWRSATRYDQARGAIDDWVATMVRTRAIDRLRRRNSRDRMMGRAASVPGHSRPNPEERLGSAQTGARVRAALAELPKQQRQALELSYFDGLSQSEIATTTATPLGTVKTRMRLAMVKLAQTLPAR
jgi:RNA polymerase sigma-70 factor (ECF subfamily)